MYVVGQKEMQLMDKYTMEEIGLPGIVLMENAGSKVVEEIVSNSFKRDCKVIVIAGGGNNGGDGFVIARRLNDLGIFTTLWVVGHPEKINGDAKLHLNVYLKRLLPIYFFHEHSIDLLNEHLKESEIIVDAILGTGIKGQVREPLYRIIQNINKISLSMNKEVIAVDIPSGVNSDTGKVGGVAVHAKKTITFVYPKKGFFLQDGPKYVGEWKAVDISVSPQLVNELNLRLPKLITTNEVKAKIPQRPANGHKGTFGHVLVIGGSTSYIGAPIYTAKAAFLTGAGLVTLAIPKTIYPIIASQNPESIFLPLADENGHFSLEALKTLSIKMDTFDVIAVGPGMNRFSKGEEWMRGLILACKKKPIIVDADGLYLLRNQLDFVKKADFPIILTPHPGEMAHLMNLPVNEIETNRIEIASEFAKKYGIYLLLKGHRTIISSPSGDILINPHGHDALSKGGSGDILTGVIASFLAQGAKPLEALMIASFLHARAGEIKGNALSNFGVTPDDIISGIREQLREFVEKPVSS
jgi:ADP-dependent NAD(P)H-hydrate dehydratase / NAD(P)H-hydrate epimerase